jgi:hypothetical protein
MNIAKTLVALNEDALPSSAKDVVDGISKCLVGKKITAFGPKGRGLWGDHHEVQTYRIKRIVAHIGPMDDGEPEWGNIDIYLDGYHAGGKKGKDAKGNDTILGGLIYTDKTFEAHLKELLRGCSAMRYIKDIGYSEQGMQGKNYVNLDIDFNKKNLANAMADNLIRKGDKKLKEATEAPHVHAHKVGDDIEWDEEHGNPESGPTGHLNTASGKISALHKKGYMVKRHDSFSGDDKDQLIHHNWARKMEPREEMTEAVDPYATQREKLGKMNSRELHDHFTRVLGATKDTIKDVARRTATRHGLDVDHYVKKN